MSWGNHIEYVCKKIMKSYGIIRRVSPLVNQSCLMTLYHSLIYPYLTYCNIVWGASYSLYLNQLPSIQKRFLRMISNSTNQAPSAPLFSKFKLLSIFSINRFQTCLFMFKFIHYKQDIPGTFHKFFLLSSDIHSYPVRGLKNFHLPLCRTSSHKSFIKFHGPQLWNSLDRSLKLISSYKMFRTSLVRYILSRQNNTHV